MPLKGEEDICDKCFEGFYPKIKHLGGSPFAEHGIGLLKQKYIRDFLAAVHLDMFRYLKDKMDPDRIFFSQGYMSLGMKNE